MDLWRDTWPDNSKILNLCWPAWAYRVLVPKDVTKRKLDVFEKAVLGLCYVGKTDKEQVALLLALHPDLIEHIITTLQERALLSPSRLPTAEGERVYFENTYEQVHDLVEAFVFQDPWTAKLYPLIVEELRAADVDRRQDGFPVLVHRKGTRRFQLPTYAHLPDVAAIQPAVPEIRQVLAAVVNNARRRRMLERGESTETISAIHMSAIRADRVSIIEPLPRPVFLWNRLYIPEGDHRWFLQSPVGQYNREADELKKSIERRASNSAALQNAIDALYLRAGIEGIAVPLQSRQVRMEIAEGRVCLFLTDAVRDTPLFERLVEVELSLIDYDQLGRLSSHAERLLIALRRSIELCIEHLLLEHPPGEIWQQLGGEDDFNQLLVQQAYRACGFQEPIPESVLTFRADEVRHVCENPESGAQSINSALATLLLTAVRNQGHAIESIARKSPEFIVEVSRIALLADPGQRGYAVSKNPTIDVYEEARAAYQIFGHVLNLPVDLSRYNPRHVEVA